MPTRRSFSKDGRLSDTGAGLNYGSNAAAADAPTADASDGESPQRAKIVQLTSFKSRPSPRSSLAGAICEGVEAGGPQ